MSNNFILELLILFQSINFVIMYMEWDRFSKDKKQVLAGRFFIFLLPILIFISLINNPI